MSSTFTDVVIVGAGPAGASTAILLAKAGLRVTLLDRARFPRAKACAECLSPQASRILDRFGVLDTLVRSSAALLDGMAVRAPDGTWLVGEYGALPKHVPYRARALAVRRERLDAVLVDAARAAGANVVE